MLYGMLSLTIVIALPTVLGRIVEHTQDQSASAVTQPFPVTVNPKNKTIIEDEEVNLFLDGENSPLQAAAGNTGSIFGRVLTLIATSISEAPWYQSIATVPGRFVTIEPGMRKEQVASAFGKQLGWNKTERQTFLTAKEDSTLPLSEGSFAAGVYFVTTGTTPAAAQSLVNDRFYQNILSHYGTSTEQVVPLAQALTVASLIEREAGGSEDMRIISGIIWNRLFLNMNLQIDATLQYAKASSPAAGTWWPKVVPNDRYRKSAYNTYLHSGLPPTPIASPSVAAVVAALNPKNTSCMYYFHDDSGYFHCSDSYAEHVALLKKFYGRGR